MRCVKLHFDFHKKLIRITKRDLSCVKSHSSFTKLNSVRVLNTLSQFFDVDGNIMWNRMEFICWEHFIWLNKVQSETQFGVDIVTLTKSNKSIVKRLIVIHKSIAGSGNEITHTKLVIKPPLRHVCRFLSLLRMLCPHIFHSSH